MKKCPFCAVGVFVILSITTIAFASDKLAPTTHTFNPWCHSFKVSYNTVFDATLKAITSEKDYDIFDYDKEGRFIYCAYRDAPYINHSIRFVAEGKDSTKVITRGFTSKEAIKTLRIIGEALGKPLPTREPGIKHRGGTKSQLLYSKDDEGTECKQYMDLYLDEE